MVLKLLFLLNPHDSLRQKLLNTEEKKKKRYRNEFGPLFSRHGNALQRTAQCSGYEMPRYHSQKKKKKSELRNEEVKIRSVFLELAGLSHTSVKGPHFIVYCKSFLFLFFFPF